MVGRDRELDACRAFLADGAPTTMVLEGPAGIGKTTVWSESVRLADEIGHRVLVTRPVEAETGAAYSGLGDLLGEPFDELGASLPEPQRVALGVALLRMRRENGAAAAPVVAAASLGVLRAAARDGPVLLAVDDLQWLDAASAAALRFALRRLEGEPVRTLATLRCGTANGDSEAIAASGERLGLTSLGLDDLTLLLGDQLGRSFPRPVLRGIERMAAGNAFVALEIARAIDARGQVDADPATALSAEQIRRLVGDRLAELPDETRDALATVAALARPRTGVVSKALDERLLDDAFATGVLVESGDELRFAHPLLAASAIGALPPHRRRAIHRALADLVTDPEERGRHLAAATIEPSATVAAALDAAAAEARRRGAPAAAAELGERAARLTPPDDVERRGARLVDAGCRYEQAGHAGRALALFREAEAELPPGALHARALMMVASHEQTPMEEGLKLGLAALAEAGSDLAVRVECLVLTAVGHGIVGRFGEALGYAETALALLDERADEEQLILTLSTAGAMEATVTPGGGRGRLRRAVALERGRAIPAPDLSPTTSLGRALHWTDELDEGRQLLTRSYDRAKASGDEAGVSDVGGYLALLECRAGNLPLARSYADESLSICEQGSEKDQNLGGSLYARALVAAHEGEEALTRELGSRGLSIATTIGDWSYAIHHHCVLGFLELSLGDAGAACDRLGPLPDKLAAAGVREFGLQPCYPDLVEALIAADRPGAAESHLADWEAFGERYDRPAALCTGARAHGLLAAHRGDHDAAIEHLERALVLHDRLPVPLERGRTLLALGAARRRAKRRRAAREALEDARSVFDAMGAVLWARRAETELARISGRSAGDRTALTPTEHQVAQLVAAGRTNREVAQELFVSVRTVESNLTRIYAKLDVRSRAELAARREP
jgi:DNA-binding CsgD family transcriptional regulator/tetratricopeptide (TPR) repeat protein